MPKTFSLKLIARELKTLVTISSFFNWFVVLNSLKLLIVHCLLDSHRIDAFIIIILAEYMISSFIYCFLPTIVGGRWLFALFYLLQVVYLSVNLTYNFIFSSNIHVSIASTLAWEFRAVYTDALSWETGVALLIAAIDFPVFIKIFREFNTIRQQVRYDTGLLFRHLAGGILTLVLIITSVNAYEFVQSGNNPDAYKKIEDYSLHHYGMFASSYAELYNFKNTKESIHKLNYGRNTNSQVIKSVSQKSMKSPSYLLIQVESLDANIINHTWHGMYVTPFLNRLSKSSLYFPYALSYHLAGGTSDTEMTILNNTEPLSDTPTISIKSYSFPNSLPMVFRKNGYDVKAFHGNTGEYYNRNAAYSEMGFDMFYDMTRMRLISEGWGASDGKVFDFATKIMGNGNKPFLNYIITMSSHEPFKNVSNYYTSSKYDDISPEKLKDYFISIEYVDRMLENFIKKTREQHPNTYIFVFGDHTPYVLNRGPYQRASFTLDNHAFEFVPMFIITPDNAKRIEAERAISFLDIAPTILKSSNAQYTYSVMGENILGKFGDRLIPYKGKQYDRKELFQLAQKTVLR